MQASGQPRNVITPLAVAVVVALIGISFLIITERDPADNAQTKAISMKTTAALERAGAVAVPTRPTGRP